MSLRLFVVITLMVAVIGLRAQTSAAVDHARRVVDSLNAEKFEDVVKEFNAQMAAALSATQLRDVWAMGRQQVGSLVSVLDDQVTMPAAGMTLVTLGCKFEKADLNVIVAFDAGAGLPGCG